MIQYYKGDSKLKPNNLTHSVKNMPDTVIVTWEHKIPDAVKKKYKTKTVGTFNFGPVLPIYSVECGDIEVGLILIPIGAPSAAAIIEESLVWGVKNLIFAGTCAILDEQYSGKILVPVKAFRTEGTSFHYTKDNGCFVDVCNHEKTSDFFRKCGIPFSEICVWTTDALFRETQGAIDTARKNGCSAIDMECSAIHAVARHVGVNVRQFFFPSDRLSDETWKRVAFQISGSQPNSNLHLSVFEICLELAKDMAD